MYILEVLCVTVGVKYLFEIADILSPAWKINPTSNIIIQKRANGEAQN